MGRMKRRRRTPGQTTADGYGADHQRARALVLALDPPCVYCGAPATHADHAPPLDLAAQLLGISRRQAAQLYTTDGTGPYRLVPACARCNLREGARYAQQKRRAQRSATVTITSLPPHRPNPSRQW